MVSSILYIQLEKALLYNHTNLVHHQMNNTKKKAHQQKQSSPSSSSSQQKPKKFQKKLSQCRDYISMRQAFRLNNLKNQKKKKQEANQPQKHSMEVHRHLQPDQPMLDDDEENELERDGDPISLLNNYTKQNYLKFLKKMKENVQNQKPYTEEPQQLLQTLASRHFNICMYGFGSKITYIRYLLSTYLGDHHCWQINGYKTGINDKKIYNHFGKFLKDIGVANRLQKITKEDQLKEYRSCLQDYVNKGNNKKLVVAFHCLDSINYLNQQSQQSLSLLFALPNIKLICSIDSIKIASIWHPRVKTRFNFRFFQINTGKPYIEQQMFRPNTTDIREQADQATMNIYKSLNSNQKRILKLFAKKQLENNSVQEAQYYTLESLLEECIQHVILSNDTQLRENLLELIDHRVILPIDRPEQERLKRYYTIKCNKGMLEFIFKDKVQD